MTFSEFISGLPAAVQGIANALLAVPLFVWVVLLLVWLVYGLIFRTAPFGLAPDDPWVLVRGRQRRRLDFHFATVVSAQERVVVREHTERRTDESGMAVGPGSTYTTTTHTQQLFLRDESGQEHTLDLTNIGLQVREGHRVLEIADAKRRHILFVHNEDLGTNTFFPIYKRYVSMRPWVLVPLGVLSFLVGANLSMEMGLKYAAGTVLAYLVTLWVINLIRRARFRRTLAPRLVAAAMQARAAAAASQIGVK